VFTSVISNTNTVKETHIHMYIKINTDKQSHTNSKHAKTVANEKLHIILY